MPSHKLSPATARSDYVPFLTRVDLMTYLPIQFRDQVYQIKATEGIQAMIPPKFIAELKGLPEDILSATEAVADVGSPAPIHTYQ